MKRLSTLLAATALTALAACSHSAANNAAAIDTTNDVYDVAPDSLTANDLGNMSADNMSGGTMTGGNAIGNASSGGNGHDGASNAARNAH